MKKIIVICSITVVATVAVLLICMLSFSLIDRYIFGDDYLSKKEIFAVVNKQHDTIISDVEKGEFTDSKSIEGIESVKEYNGIIDFYCGGKGISVSGFDYGFYYTADDLPKAVEYVSFGEGDSLTPEGDGYCFNKYNYYYTEKIRDNFYYYEIRF